MQDLELTERDVLLTRNPRYCLACGRLRPLVICLTPSGFRKLLKRNKTPS